MPLVLLAVSVTAGMPLRSGAAVLPWLKITIPTAPAAAAFSALISNVQVPRCSSAMFPAGKPAKSAASHPLVEVLPRPELQVDGRDGRGDVAGVGLGDRPEVDALDIGDRARRGLLEGRRADDLVREVVERLDLGVIAGGLERVDHVVDRGVVAREAGEAVAAVRVGDRLERRLVLADPLDPHALEQLVVRVVRPVRTASLRRRRQRRAAWQQRHGSHRHDAQQRRHACGDALESSIETSNSSFGGRRPLCRQPLTSRR